RGNDLRPLYFHDVRVPPENVLGEPGEGFRIAMDVLNNGRLSLGTGSVGLAKKLVDLAIDHVTTRRQFGRPLADFDMVEDKIGWMVSYLFGLESLAYLTTGLVDAGIEDYSVESAIAKVIGTEFVWYQANRALQLKGGAGYLRDEPYEQILRDIRVFPIFEGANDVMRSFIALADVYAQIAVLSRVTSIFEEQGVEASGQERFIADTFCTRAAHRVDVELDKIDNDDDERTQSIARLAYKRGAYGYALFED